MSSQEESPSVDIRLIDNNFNEYNGQVFHYRDMTTIKNCVGVRTIFTPIHDPDESIYRSLIENKNKNLYIIHIIYGLRPILVWFYDTSGHEEIFWDTIDFAHQVVFESGQKSIYSIYVDRHKFNSENGYRVTLDPTNKFSYTFLYSIKNELIMEKYYQILLRNARGTFLGRLCVDIVNMLTVLLVENSGYVK